MKELNQGQVNNTHLSKSFLTHIAWVFSIVGEKPREAECIWGIVNFFRVRLKSCNFLSQANKLKLFKSIWNNLFGLMVGEKSSHIREWNSKWLNFNLWQLGRMWPRTPQKWQAWTNLGTSVFLIANLLLDFSFCLNKEQFGIIWPTTPQRWQVGTKTDLICSLTVGFDLGLETSAPTSEFLPLSNLAQHKPFLYDSSWKEG